MNEIFLTYLWKFQLFNQTLLTTDFDEILVKKPGIPNHDAGPDFSNALIQIGGTIWSGHVEIHVKSSDWLKHKHQNNKKYRSVILHVVFEDDLGPDHKTINIPTLEIKNNYDERLFFKYQSFMSNMSWIPCENQIKEVDRFRLYHFMNRMAIERLEHKSEKIMTELKSNKNNLEQTFYELLARNFGFKTNSDAFGMLAKSLPILCLSKHKNNLLQIEAMLFGQAGMLNKRFKESYPQLLVKEYHFLKRKFNLTPIPSHTWKFSRLRPGNFPSIRISQFAMLIYRSSALLSQIIEMEELANIRNLFNISASDYWDSHYNFDKRSSVSKKQLGHQAVNLILINSIIPILFVYGQVKGEEKYIQKALRFLDAIEGEQNQIIRQWKKIGLNTSTAFFTQALLHLKTEYCNYKRCLDCQIGHDLIKASTNNSSI